MYGIKPNNTAPPRAQEFLPLQLFTHGTPITVATGLDAGGDALDPPLSSVVAFVVMGDMFYTTALLRVEVKLLG